MVAVAQKSLVKKGQNVSKLPFSKMTDEQLLEIVNGAAEEFLGTLRKAFVQFAKRAGDALIELKRRHKPWRAWLKEHFDGSPETASVYMNVARHWKDIVEAGMEGTTLADIRRFLADADEDEDEVEEEPEKKQDEEDQGDEDIDGDEDEAEDDQVKDKKEKDAKVKNPKLVKVWIAQAAKPVFDNWVTELMPELGTQNISETVYEAVHLAYKEKCHAETHSVSE